MYYAIRNNEKRFSTKQRFKGSAYFYQNFHEKGLPLNFLRSLFWSLLEVIESFWPNEKEQILPWHGLLDGEFAFGK